MPQVQPITITVDALSTELKPVGKNGNGTVSYRSDDRHQFVTLTPKSDASGVIDRAQGRINGIVDVQDHLDPAVSVERTYFGKFEISKHSDIPASVVFGQLIELLQDAQTIAIANGESFYG